MNGHVRPDKPHRRRLNTIALGIGLMLSATVVGCPSPSRPTTRPPTPRPPAATPLSSLQQALDAAWNRYEILDDGQLVLKPFILDWSQVESSMNLTAQQNLAFCGALDRPGVDDVLTSLITLGLNALSQRLRRRPLSTEASDVINLAAKFAVKSCPGWIPVVNPVRPVPATPVPNWHPAGFGIVWGDPDLVWRWWDPNDYRCDSPIGNCWMIDVFARSGCSRLDATLHVKDATDAVVDVVEETIVDVPALEATPIGFGSVVPRPTTGEVIYLTCQ